MIKDHAKFTGEIAKGIKIGESSVEVKLLIPLKAALPHLLFLSSNQGEEINVFLGDPQGAFDFGEDEDGMYQASPGRRVTTDASGVVTSIGEREGDDPNQANLFSQQEGSDSEQTGDGEGEVSPDKIEGSEQQEQEQTGEGEPGDAGMKPEWLDGEGQTGGEQGEPAADGQDGEGTEGEASGESASGEGGEADNADPADHDSQEEVSKEELDKFILQERPIFPEIEYEGQPIPFPDLLEKRLKENKVWREIAIENGMTSGQLSSRYNAYRKLAAKKMQGGGGAA
ncbi:hypothetical protein J2Z22_001615 [Paenibacillus forsythiae]|uniref:Uncharacterized protein n=1 Tax=Paenibacillus forsythiae TaxID=365616 RepID=A0ABU3H5U1_9BACL|nr:hypothetical protein [Paenibacillus forsythiae]MDT3426095.1 hypothetical protein [Paenibacillus forsythiae]